MAKTASDTFDEHERPTAPRTNVLPDAAASATSRMDPVDLDALIARHGPARPASGTRPVVTPAEIERFVREREERETLDALTLQRKTLPMETIPIDVDESAFVVRPREPLGLPRQQRWLLAILFAVAIASALLGFVAGRASL